MPCVRPHKKGEGKRNGRKKKILWGKEHAFYIHVRDYPLKDIEHFSLSDSYQILQYIFKYHNEHKYIFNCWCKWNVGQFMKMDTCLSCSFVLACVWMVWIHSTAASVHARACTHTHTPFTCIHKHALTHTHTHVLAWIRPAFSPYTGYK